MAAAPASGAPAYTGITMTAGVPTSSAGTNGAGGRPMTTVICRELLGRLVGRVHEAAQHLAGQRQEQRATGHHGHRVQPVGGTGSQCRSCRRRRAAPRRGRGRWPRSRCGAAPSAVTRSTASRLSIVMPCLRVSQPMPPPSVRPAEAHVAVSPNGVARPCCVGGQGVLAGGRAALRRRRCGARVESTSRIAERSIEQSAIGGRVAARHCGRHPAPRGPGHAPRPPGRPRATLHAIGGADERPARRSKAVLWPTAASS